MVVNGRHRQEPAREALDDTAFAKSSHTENGLSPTMAASPKALGTLFGVHHETESPMKTMSIGTLLALLSIASFARADAVRLSNGDVLNGELVRVDEQIVLLKSETLGELKLEREKVVSIHLGDAPVSLPAEAGRAKETAAPPADAALQQLLGRRVTAPGRGGDTPEDVLRRLREGGVGAAEMRQLRQQFPLLATPEAGGYFESMVGGLVGGTRDLSDLRRDSVRARDELQDLKEELGEPGNALNGYLSILDTFITQVPADPQAEPETPRGTQRYEDGRPLPPGIPD